MLEPIKQKARLADRWSKGKRTLVTGHLLVSLTS